MEAYRSADDRRFATMLAELRHMMAKARGTLMERCAEDGDASGWMLLNDYDCRRLVGDPDAERRIVEEAGKASLDGLFMRAMDIKEDSKFMNLSRLDAVITMREINAILRRIR